MEESILKCVKKILGVHPDDTSFDLDILIHINSAFSNLHQLGIGPTGGFQIASDEDEWADFEITSLPILNQLKTCIYLRVRMLFDPPTTSYLMAAMEKQIVEHEYRLNVMREETAWVDPDPPTPDFDDDEMLVIDGGDA